ncbi:type IV secretion system DNA-binding domain-containing protein [Vulcaniibacterium gelatinicum]|uniref:type IV secretion system DNA-binding domain-containing protein n=1 Tax=Vulcaniibacterium gelatinicum TaxID=2598725 RepID=UPI0011C9D11C|nr:type IV secretion system DNA-binding domain-containing protein [Vulcaniibacterium gelatinicum]
MSRRTYAEEGLIGALFGGAAGAAVALGVFGLGGGAEALLTALGRPPRPEWAHWWAAASPLARIGAAIGPWMALGCGLVGAVIVGWLLARQADEWHVRGLVYDPDPESFRSALAQAERTHFSAAQAAGTVTGLEIGGVELSRARETAHMLVVGLPGAGKTTLLYAIVSQALARGDRVLVHDPKGDFVAEFSAGLPAERVALLGPWDARARPWDIAADVATPAAADQLARACFPREDAGANQFFVHAARELLAGLIRNLQQRGAPWGWADLAALLSGGPEAIIVAAHVGNPLCRVQVPDAAHPGSRAVLAELATGAAWMPGYAGAFAPTAAPFSVRRWALGQSPERLVALNADARYSARAEQVFGGLLAALADAVASPAMPERAPDAPGIWLVVDELPQLSPAAQAALLRIEEMGRSRGVRVIKALQDPAQLRAQAGADKAEAVKSMQQTRVYLRLATAAAAAVCKDLGDREIERLEFPLTTGQGNKRIIRERAPVLRVDTLMGLQVLRDRTPGVEMVVSIGDRLGRLIQPFPARPAVTAPAQVPNPRWDAVAPPVLPPADPSATSTTAPVPEAVHDGSRAEPGGDAPVPAPKGGHDDPLADW